MNKKIFVLLIVFASLLTFGLVAAPDTTVHAQAGGCVDATGAACTPTPQPQGCVDATGAPCTPTPEPGGGGGGNQNPPASVVTATFTAIPTLTTVPTSTPFPIALPESDFLGSCTSENFSECKEQFKCENGLLVIKVDLYSGNGTKYDFYCIPHEEAPILDLPLTLPDPDTQTANWVGVCFAGELDSCLDLMAAGCAEEGGEYSEWYDDEGGAGAYCQNSSEAGQVAPTATPLAVVAASTDDGSTDGNEDWDEECSWASCWAVDLACWMDGGSGYVIEDSVGNTGYHCDMPAESNTLPPSSWLPWAVGIVILVGMLLPAIQKVRAAATRSAQTKEHILLARQPTNSTGKPKPQPKPKPTPPPSKPSSSDLESWRANFGSSSQGSPKPTPKPTPPPSKPKPSGGSKGDFNSDGDVDGSDYNPYN